MKEHINYVRDCTEFKDLYTFYVYGDISPEEEKIISEHLKDCQECANEVNSLRETLKLLNVENELTIPQSLIDNFESKMYKRIAAESLKSPVRNIISTVIDGFLSRRFILIPSTVTVAIIVSILIGIYAFNSFFNTQPEELYSISNPSAHKRIEQYNQRELQRLWEDALLTRYVEGDDWSAVSEFRRLKEENPGTSLASMADRELSKANADLKDGI